MGTKDVTKQTRKKRLESVFGAEVEDAINEQTPIGGRRIIWLAAACLGCLLIWASIAEVDEVSRGEGKVIPSRNVQVVQSMDGGVVAEIHAREGASVKRGQPLLRIEAVRAKAQRGETLARMLAQRVRMQRLLAEAAGDQRIAWDPDIAQVAPAMVRREADLFRVRLAEHLAALTAADQQIRQRTQEAREATVRRDSARRSLALLEREVNYTRPLLETGAVSEIEVIRLERELARLRGEAEGAAVQIERSNAAIAEARQRRLEAAESFRARARTELNEAAADLARLEASVEGLQDRVEKTVLRAPVAGIVKTLHAHTVGGVAQAGKDLVEIVPIDDTLLVEARIQPRDIGFLHLGQRATVRFHAYDYAVHGGLSGQVEHISADTVTDERNNAFYIVRIRTRPDHDGHGIGSRDRPIIAGMTATVDIMTGKRTVLTYLMKPLLRAKQKAFTER
ncbi:MAG: HlyD family type I secretion periplasmic adaptor subunit [Burkholderiaceae bacterium]